MSACEHLQPLPEHDPGYPSLVEQPLLRREALRALALAALGGLGLELVGCPGGPGPGGGGGGGSGGLDWIPWRDRTPRVAGEMMPVQAAPVAVVVGGQPLAVTFQDGRQAALAVALVVPADAAGAATRAARQAAAVQAAAASLPGSVLDDAQGLRRLEARVLEEVHKQDPDLPCQAVEVAPALEPPPQAPREASREERQESRAPQEPAPAREAAAEAAPATAPSQARLWVPCSKPGCTSCGR